MAKTNYCKEIKNYLDDLGKRGYQPGGGSAGALAFCLGVSLIIKSIRHSNNENTVEARKNKLDKRLDRLAVLKKRVYSYIDKDGEIFSKIMESKGSKKQKELEKGKDLIKSLAQSARQAFSLAKGVESDIKKSIKSDFYLGLEFIKVSQLSAAVNWEANKKMFG